MITLTPEPWAEIAQHLCASSVIRHGMILEDMERGIDTEQIASRQRIARDTATSYMRDVEARPLRQARHLLNRDLQIGELAKELGFRPATTNPEDIERHRRQRRRGQSPTMDKISRKHAHLWKGSVVLRLRPGVVLT